MAEPYEQPIYRARLRPHRSLTRAQAKALVAIVSAALAVTTVPFFLMGAWPVVGFLGLDALGLWLAFEISFRSARAYEDTSA